jgi:hypothetical protein
MGGAAVGAEILVGLVDDQRDAATLRQTIKGVDEFGWIGRSGRIVGADEDDRARARRDQPLGVLRIWQRIVASHR